MKESWARRDRYASEGGTSLSLDDTIAMLRKLAYTPYRQAHQGRQGVKGQRAVEGSKAKRASWANQAHGACRGTWVSRACQGGRDHR